MKVKWLEHFSESGGDVRYHRREPTFIEKKKELAMKLETAIKTLSQRFKEEEISNQKLKESVIAERIKNEMNLTLILFGLNWCGKNATEKNPFVRSHFMPFTNNNYKQYNDIYQGVTINIFELDRFKSYEQTLESMFYWGKLTKKHDIVCLVNFPASGNCTPDLIQRFGDFLKSSKRRNTKMVPVFTLYDELQLFNPLKENRDKKKTQWLMNFSKTLSSKVQENEIKYMIIEHGYSFELPENRKELLNMCGLNIL